MRILKAISSEKRLLGIIIILAALVRFGYFFFNFDPTTPPTNDSLEYHLIAQNLVQGKGYMINGQQTAFRAPFLTYLTAGIYLLFGVNFIAARLVIIIFSVVLVWGIYELARTLSNHRVGLWSAFIAAFWIHFVLYGTRIFTEIPYTLFAILAVLMVIKYIKNSRFSVLILAALFFALAILTRPVGLFLFGVVTVYLILRIRTRKNIRRVIVMAGLTLLFIFPWTVRNYIVFHRIIPVTSASGLVLWISNNHYVAHHPMRWGGYVGFEQLPGASAFVSPDEMKRTDYSIAFTKEFLKEYPGDIPLLLWNKTKRFWSPDIVTRSPRNWIIEYSYVILLIFALAGIIYTIRSKFPGTIWLWIIIIANFIPSLIYWAGHRIRLPAEPALIIFAAIILDYVRVRLWKRNI
jgi:4-amino-4-deoxy-L-arabinose transferase-like glycosyltransferase